MASKELTSRVGCHDTIAREPGTYKGTRRCIGQGANERQVVGRLRIVTTIHLGGSKYNNVVCIV